MIIVEMSLAPPGDGVPAGYLEAADSCEATAIIRELVETADDRHEPRLWLRVTGAPTAASCRHHPLAPGTIGDPRR